MNGLFAHLTADEEFSTNYYSKALSSISMGLEKSIRRRRKLDIEQWRIIIHCNLPAATVWFTTCGKGIFAACLQRKCSDMEATGNLWEGEKGFSIVRWEFWKRRLGELSGHLEVTEETRRVCSAAVNAMNSAEA